MPSQHHSVIRILIIRANNSFIITLMMVVIIIIFCTFHGLEKLTHARFVKLHIYFRGSQTICNADW